MKHPEVAKLALAAFEASGAKTHKEFIDLFGPDTIAIRSFRGWIAGTTPAAPIAQLLLREFVAGWRPRLDLGRSV